MKSYSLNKIYLLFSILGSCILSSSLSASSAKNAPGAYFSATFGSFVYKSDTVNGTDFANYTAFDLGTYYGKDKNIGMSLHYDKMKTNFRQTEASIATEFTEFLLSYRASWFLPTLIMGNGLFETKSDQQLELGSEGKIAMLYSGVGVDFEYPHSQQITSYARVRSVNFTTTYDAEGRLISSKTKREIDIGIRFTLPVPVITMAGGFFHRSFGLSIDENGMRAQVQTGPYVSAMLGHSF